ncbi:MAG TPA: hypothetical protein VJG32_21615 [Anaerolineae bacterium]|nr:hypothetical protein [Anaerolineae bacterium]
MSQPTTDLLQQGIAAVKAGQRDTARALLMQVIEADEKNEQAWLWLSGAVETADDRRVCLENVLALNPNNAAAQRGLAKLGPAPAPPEQAPREIVMRRERPPNSPAAAILYPEKQVEEWRWQDTPDLKRVPAIEYQVKSAYDDIWNTAKDICGYCAQEVTQDDRKCPSCKRNLIGLRFRREQPGVNLFFMVVLVLSLMGQFVAQFFLDLRLQVHVAVPVFDAVLALFLLLSAIGIYLRQRAAYLTALGLLVIVLGSGIIRATTSIDARNELIVVIAVIVRAAHIITALLGLLLGIFSVGADFETVESRHVARLGEDLKRAGDFYHSGKAFAEKGMWAMAVPYWQRVAAANPTNIAYQRALGEAYARLGFYDRSLDVLGAALERSADPAVRAEIEELVQSVRRQQSARAPIGSEEK